MVRGGAREEFFFPRQASIVDKLRFPSIANNSPGNRITQVEIHGGCSKTFYLAVSTSRSTKRAGYSEYRSGRMLFQDLTLASKTSLIGAAS